MQFPRWLSWVVLVFLAYILFVGNSPRERTTPEPATVAASDKDYPHLQALVDGERWVKAINPDYVTYEDACKPLPPAASEDIRLGNFAILNMESPQDVGPRIACGETGFFTFILYDRQGKGQKLEEKQLILGEQKGLDALLIGMRPGYWRVLIFTPTEKISALPMLKPGTMYVMGVGQAD